MRNEERRTPVQLTFCKTEGLTMDTHAQVKASHAAATTKPGSRPLAVVTGASSGIGYELAKLCAQDGCDLVVAADDLRIETAAHEMQSLNVLAKPVRADLATQDGVDRLYREVQAMGRPVDILCANAGRGLGHAFLDQDFRDIKDVIDTNVTGTLYLLHKFGRDMRERGAGRILITGSIAGFVPGTYQAVYNGTKAFIDNFSYALRHELKDSGVTVTCLMPGATETEFFEKAGMENTQIGQGEKDKPADVAKTGFDAMMRGEGSVVHGVKNKLQTAAAGVLPQGVLAEQHAKQAKPQ